MTSKPRLLWIGDAGVSSGFERGTRYSCLALQQDFDVHCLALNYRGDPNWVNGKAEPWPFTLWPCYAGGDMFGVGRIKEMLARLTPACVVVQNDPWNFRVYQDKIGPDVPTIGVVAVDGKNCRGEELNGLKLAIFWTEFGEEQARLGGYTGPSAVIPLGVDLNIYKPYDKKDVRSMLRGIKDVLAQHGRGLDTFVVGVVGRNQSRKRLDLTLDYFAEWAHGGTPVEQRSSATLVKKDAVIWMHVAPTGEQAYDIEQMARYLGITDQTLVADIPLDGGLPETTLAMIYNVFDVYFSTTQGEGFGLPCFEAMACGVPPIVPDWSAFGELIGEAGLVVPCTSTIATDRGLNVIGGVMDKRMAVESLELMYSDKKARARYSHRSLSLVGRPCYRWESIGEAVRRAVTSTLDELKAMVA